MLVVLTDCLQYPFQADEKIYDKYLFTLKGSSEASIDVEIDLRKQDVRMTPECIRSEKIELMMGGSENQDKEYEDIYYDATSIISNC